ncbi:hypothetical protein J3R82DRAFT_6332 [Butyriboletus roseoflavus]|nr:hypothetical protein J3R82DRAFT_6332 [Butyriboletus roseoflavus]
MFPSGPSPFVHPDHLEEALSLALWYKITWADAPSVSVALRESLYAYSLDDSQIQKGIYYSLVTTTDFEPSSAAASNKNAVPSKPMALTPTDIERCRNLMNGIVEHFTPVLFEPVCPILSIAFS